MSNKYKDENGKTWYNYIDVDDICTSFSAEQTGKTPCDEKDTDKTKTEIETKAKSKGAFWNNPVNMANTIYKNIEENGTPEQKQKLAAYKDGVPNFTEKKGLPTWGWVGIGVISAGIITTIIILTVKAAKKAK